MFTVEFESDASVITVMDETAKYDDVEIIISDSSEVFIRQFDNDANTYDMIVLTFKQLIDIFAAINSPEGMFKIELTRSDKQ